VDVRRPDEARESGGVQHDVYSLPEGLPVPEDDGAADHLVGMELPDLVLDSSLGPVNVRDFTVIYVYPRSGRPDQPLLPGWDETPGARGCTPQSCAFRDLHRELGAALGLPMFDIAELTLYKRITLVAQDARIVKVFYPVFPPDRHAAEVLTWLGSR